MSKDGSLHPGHILLRVHAQAAQLPLRLMKMLTDSSFCRLYRPSLWWENWDVIQWRPLSISTISLSLKYKINPTNQASALERVCLYINVLQWFHLSVRRTQWMFCVIHGVIQLLLEFSPWAAVNDVKSVCLPTIFHHHSSHIFHYSKMCEIRYEKHI